jgi:hypothetical protein
MKIIPTNKIKRKGPADFAIKVSVNFDSKQRNNDENSFISAACKKLMG